MGRKKSDDNPTEVGEVTVTILHVSDMQFGRQHRFGRLGLGGADEKFDTLLKRLTDDLDLLRENESVEPDLVALTGDLAEWGKPKEYQDVLAFCEGVQTHLKLGRDRILVIPGNHDLNRPLCESYFKKCEGLDEHPVEPYWPKWEPYVDFFGRLYTDVDRYEFKETEPYTWFEVPDLRVAIAGLNSTMRESHREKEESKAQDSREIESIFGHYGYVGEAQLDWFKKKLDEAAAKAWLRIGLVHHNAVRRAELDDENLRDAQILEDRIGAKLNLLLHGHTHNGSIGWLGRDLPVISTGSSAVKVVQRPEEVPNQYQIIQVHRTGFRCWARQYTPKERKWIGDPRVSKDGSDWRHEQQVNFPQTSGTFGALESDSRRDGVSKFRAGHHSEDAQHGVTREPDRGENPFYPAGSLPPGHPSYVVRRCDAVLTAALVNEPLIAIEGNFQTGKSSLALKARAALAATHTACYVDLQSFRCDDAHIFDDFFEELSQQLGLKVASWRKLDAGEGPPLALFIDEVGCLSANAARFTAALIHFALSHKERVRLIACLPVRTRNESIESFLRDIGVENAKYRREWRRVQIEPLDTAEIERMIALLPPRPRALVREHSVVVARLSRGNPKAVQQVLAAIFDANAASVSLQDLENILANGSSYE